MCFITWPSLNKKINVVQYLYINKAFVDERAKPQLQIIVTVVFMPFSYIAFLGNLQLPF